MTTGMSVRPSAPRKSVVSMTDVSGRPSMAVISAPMPMAAPTIIGRPARCDSAMPPAAPMNSPGKTGPPRKLLSEMP